MQFHRNNGVTKLGLITGSSSDNENDANNYMSRTVEGQI